MYPGEDGRCMYDAIRKLVIAGAEAGLDIDNMVKLLNAGMSVTDLFNYIEARSSAAS